MERDFRSVTDEQFIKKTGRKIQVSKNRTEIY